MEVLSDIKIRRGSWASVVAYCSWSTSSNGIGSTTLAPACSINRYYDPSTDQFISIDPAVTRTNQPYVFTNDNPLNAEDPLGLCIRDAKGDCTTAATTSKTTSTKKTETVSTKNSSVVIKIVSAVNDAVSDVPGLPRVLTDSSGFLTGVSSIIQNAGNPPAAIVGGVVGGIGGSVGGAAIVSYYFGVQADEIAGPEAAPFGFTAGVFVGAAVGGYEGAKWGASAFQKAWSTVWNW
jgi:hypothetical protein